MTIVHSYNNHYRISTARGGQYTS